jgi:hypothetical protein
MTPRLSPNGSVADPIHIVVSLEASSWSMTNSDNASKSRPAGTHA